MLKLIVAAGFLTASDVLITPNEQAISEQAQKMWAAFQCGQYAMFFEPEDSYSDTNSKYFNVGYEAGSIAFHLVDESKIDIGQLALEAEMPRDVLVRSFPRPNNDFAIGRVYEAASEKAWNKVLKGISADDQERAKKMKLNARQLFQEENCRFLRLK